MASFFEHHLLSQQEIWNPFDAIYGAKVNNRERSPIIDSKTCLTGLIKCSSDEDSIADEISDFQINDLVLLCQKVIENNKTLELKNNKLEREQAKLHQKNNDLENELKNIKKNKNSNCKRCLNHKKEFARLHENFQKLENEILIREKNETELICKNNILQKELDCFKKSEISKCTIFEKKLNEINENFKTLEKENVILSKSEIIRLNHEFEKEIEKNQGF